VIARLNLLDSKEVRPGMDAFAEFHLSAPLLFVPGDRFIFRQFSPVITIGGGVVLDAFPLKKVPAAGRTDFLRALISADVTRGILERVRRRDKDGLTLQQLTTETGLGRTILQPCLASLTAQNAVTQVGELLIENSALRTVTDSVVRAVTDFHARNPLVQGISKESLRERLRLTQAAFELALNSGVSQGKLVIAGDLVHLPGRSVVMKDEEAESRKVIENAFSSAGLKVPALKDVLAGLKIDKTRAQKIVTLLLRDKTLIKVSDELVFHRSALDNLRTSVVALKSKSPKIDVSRFKGLTGVSRKYAIPLLEYLDRERVTKRVGDERVIL
jgi:selenocysteine-specific elongation factor